MAIWLFYHIYISHNYNTVPQLDRIPVGYTLQESENFSPTDTPPLAGNSPKPTLFKSISPYRFDHRSLQT